MYDPYADFTKHTLPNGLGVHTFFWENRPWVIMEFVVHSGGREDSPRKSGLAHYTEHVVSKNIPGYTSDKAEEFFEGCGGRVCFGETGYLATKFDFYLPARRDIVRQALAMFGSMLFEAKIVNDVEHEREVIVREFNERYPFAEKLEWDMRVRRALFQGHRLMSWNRALGRRESIHAITAEDLQGFYDTHYTPANMSVVVVGGMSTDDVLTELQVSPFGTRKDGVRNPIPPPFRHIRTPVERKKVVRIAKYVNFTVDRTDYTATWAFPATFPRQARRVFGMVLGRILYNELREKRGIVYHVGARSRDFQDVCEYEIGMAVHPGATDEVDDLVRGCIMSVPTRRDLFDHVREKCVNACSMIDLSGKALAGNVAEELALHHRIISMREVYEDLNRVTFDEMAEAVEFLSPERQFTFIVVP